MPDSIEQIVGFGTIFGGLLGLVPFSIAMQQGKTKYAVAALAACTIAGTSVGEKMALPVFSSLTVVALVQAKDR
jgi:VIT1/CCC1 family predicted Fe2+/Mn2+ transporter